VKQKTITDNFAGSLIIKRDDECYALIQRKIYKEADCIILNSREALETAYFILEKEVTNGNPKKSAV